jgi:hypothetical protein
MAVNAGQVRNFLATISGKGVRILDKLASADPKYLNPRHWKITDTGYATNTWVVLYTDSEIGRLGSLLTNAKNNLVNVPEALPNQEVDADDTIEGAVLLDNISINISRNPTVVEYNVSGLQDSVKQFFGNNSYTFTISGLTSGATFFMQDSNTLRALLNVLNSGQSLNIVNPELEIIYNTNKVVVTDYNLSQDTRNYNIKRFTITCKSDNAKNIISQLDEGVTNV